MINFSVLLHAQNVVQFDEQTRCNVVGGAYAWRSYASKSKEDAIASAIAWFERKLLGTDYVQNTVADPIRVIVEEIRRLREGQDLFQSGVVFYIDTETP